MECSCDKCRECCEREPGWFAPGEILIAARFMELSEREFIAQFCEEHLDDGVIAISPARKSGKAECIFLNSEGLCAIHEVKPYECRKVMGCQGAHRHRRLREIIRRMWS